MHLPRVLVVDNEPLIRDMLQECLAAEGWEIVCAADADEALRVSPRPDVALIEAVLPGSVSGRDLGAQLEAEGVGVVMMSGQPAILEEMAEWNGRPVLAKPFRIAELLAALEAVDPREKPAVDPGRRLGCV
jgi:DNA-binding response OmpR family regulator